MKYLFIYSFFIFISILGCQGQIEEEEYLEATHVQNTNYDSLYKTIHVFVALCDNTYQGIVMVPPKIGNGQDPNNNLYWGCGYGIRTYFKKSKEWKLIKTIKGDSLVMERLVFKHVSKNFYLVADAYNGKYIKQCTHNFLMAVCGQTKDTLSVNQKTIGIYGNSSLVSYIGHDGLMDFELENIYENRDGKNRSTIILACISREYFSSFLKKTKAQPLVWTTGLMCPEAYTLHDAISGFVLNETPKEIRNRASAAYAKYQKCSLKAAQNLLVTGWK